MEVPLYTILIVKKRQNKGLAGTPAVGRKEFGNLEMVIKKNVNYTPTGKERTLHIWLPDHYDQSTERYPVMYFFDGHNLFSDQDATFGTCWGFADFLKNWNKQMILVGIECGHGEGERLSEYLPYPRKTGFFAGYEALGDATMKWILDEIKPMIDADYRTIPFRECTGIGGSSLGGLMALFGVVRYNQMFSKAACVSSAIDFCSQPVMKDIQACDISPDTRVFLSWGTMEAKGIKDATIDDRTSTTYRGNKGAANKLEAKGATVELFCQIGGNHCEADWSKQIPGFMSFLWEA